ncbi:N-acetyllactosaminide beta-1,3-N-acetylglucosaminyltransferase 2 isoform X5 [Corythoichthys intestinalis]|uniref:N-acetyllactosaminide beta-1,3-N-acetylglucosaminyltransferase 2 isoform X5 n=1 Tax=Corythoichthys intestinalis TaxID=161448 RepID=UPI0025A54927|nr:N-acetyllactosaminide beta-1,3-N-acetylglucosaminyltransferase 2-like isoform X5 [Corythoichthys intestinalis]XP_061794640.1 N-acetyllactosaminide beta-1,3-N-acetylglucosaminyltransferase 2-like [Nerophis lumbriciformis]
MALLRVRLKVLVTVTMVNVFLFLLIARHSGRDKGYLDKVRIPSKPFWNKITPSSGYWNRQQQVLDFQNNPFFANHTVGDLPDWLNVTHVSFNACRIDTRVTAQVKDYSSLPLRFKDFLLYMHCRYYPILVDQPDICRDPPFLLLAVKSVASHFDRRQAIRQTWGQAGLVANRTVVTIFLLGKTSTSDHHPDLSAMLSYESERHRDIIQWDYRDSFFNLTVKEVLFLDWIQTRCPGASFIFKGDDDVFVNTFAILKFLAGLSPTKADELFVGDVITNAGPHRDKKVKYFIPESVFIGSYPPYAGGGGYLFSASVAARLHVASRRVVLYPIDDVYTGMCLLKAGLGPEMHKGFKTFNIEEKYRSNPCVYKGLILVHPRTPQEMIQIWSWLNQPDLNCQ